MLLKILTLLKIVLLKKHSQGNIQLEKTLKSLRYLQRIFKEKWYNYNWVNKKIYLI